MAAKKTTVTQLFLTDDISKLAKELIESGEYDSFILIGHGKGGGVRIKHNLKSSAELIGVLTIALAGVTDRSIT